MATGNSKGVGEAFAVVLVASPGASESSYVEAEKAVAKKDKKVVIPVWASGDDWIPLKLIGHQYIDCRGDAYDAGVDELIEHLTASLYEQQPTLFVTGESNARDYPGRFSIRLAATFLEGKE